VGTAGERADYAGLSGVVKTTLAPTVLLAPVPSRVNDRLVVHAEGEFAGGWSKPINQRIGPCLVAGGARQNVTPPRSGSGSDLSQSGVMSALVGQLRLAFRSQPEVAFGRCGTSRRET
jgi:hypothetical protein